MPRPPPVIRATLATSRPAIVRPPRGSRPRPREERALLPRWGQDAAFLVVGEGPGATPRKPRWTERLSLEGTGRHCRGRMGEGSEGDAMYYRLISADDHLDLQYLPADLWTARLPKSLRDRAPRPGAGTTASGACGRARSTGDR